MENIVTVDEIKNEIGVDLQTALGKTPTLAQNWLNRQTRVILNYIADYAWGCMATVERYLAQPRKRAVIRRAIIEHVSYLDSINYVEPYKLAEKSKAGDRFFIAPLAKMELENGGLLSIMAQ